MPYEINNSELPTPNSQLILIVEDSAIQAEMLRRILVREGYDAVVAKDGAEGLEATQKQKPNLILSDINMPVMNGYEMCSKIKQEAALRDIPLSARILTIADTVDAMGADRPYRKGRPMDAILAELKRCSGMQFDPKVVEAFLRVSGNLQNIESQAL